MPNKDGTGPEGKGQRTGRQMGNCKDARPLGFGRGLGRRFFKRRNFRELQDKEED
ncbi:MAG: DUF5320 domain-containing protein [Nanoarchaeota archaeon]